MNTAIAYTPASGLSLPRLPPRSSSWRQAVPSTGPPKKPEVDHASYIAFPSLSSGGSSAKAPLLVGAKMDFKKAAAAAPAIAPPTSVPSDTKVSVKSSTITVKVQKHPYAEEYEDEDWPSEEDEEFNANLTSDRRRGDKGFW
jgi:hypothetical protein